MIMTCRHHIVGMSVAFILAWCAMTTIHALWEEEPETPYATVNSISWEEEGKVVIH